MSENAPGQLLGFTIQYPRALCHLLRATPGCAVCIEVHGDVATLRPDGGIDAEEDKSSIISNPVTDKSTDFWKTLYNWLKAIKLRELDIDKTTFILYRNKSGRNGIADAFDKACTPEAAHQALVDAKQKLGGIACDHPIWPHYKYAAIDHAELLERLILNFRLETGVGAGFADVETEVRAKLVPASQVSFLIQCISGWLVRKVAEKISENQQAKITWEEFNSEFLVFFSRARRRELIDFALQSPPSSQEIATHLSLRPTYLRQIELIQGTDDDLLEAVTDFLKAKVNRDRWIEDDVIDEPLASDFEEKLLRFWKNTKKKIDITLSSRTVEERGDVLMRDCLTRSETIRGESVPDSTVAGTYHALADQPALGWHPVWSARLKK
jgi:hypothetical protein